MSLVFLMLLTVQAGAVRAQELELRGPEPSQVNLGAQAVLEIVYRGKDQTKAQALPPLKVDGLQIRIGGPQPSSFTQITNGRVFREESVSWKVFLVPERTGRFVLPPFRVRVGDKMLATRRAALRCVEDLKAKHAGFLEAGAARSKVYLHQPIDFWIRVGVDAGVIGQLVQGDASQGQIGVFVVTPWIDEFPAGVPVETGSAERKVRIILNNRWQEAIYLDTETRNERDYHVFEIRRRFLPNRAGSFLLEAPRLSFEYVTKFRRNVFGERVPVETGQAFFRAKTISLAIRALPEEGRPADFRNAVGSFRVRGELASRKLEVGESVPFALRVEGDGNLEFLELPELDDVPGFHRFAKKVERKNDHVLAIYDMSPLDHEVTEFPAIGFSYFDPTAEPPSYKLAIVPAIPVVVAKPASSTSLEPLPEPGKALTPGVDDIWDRMPIEGPPPRRFHPKGWMFLGALGAPFALLLLWFGFLRRRAFYRAHPEKLRSKRAAQSFAKALTSDGALRAFTVYLSDRLGWDEGAAVREDLAARLQEAGVSDALAERCHELLNRLLASRYSGESGEGGLAAEAQALVSEFDREVRV